MNKINSSQHFVQRVLLFTAEVRQCNHDLMRVSKDI